MHGGVINKDEIELGHRVYISLNIIDFFIYNTKGIHNGNVVNRKYTRSITVTTTFFLRTAGYT